MAGRKRHTKAQASVDLPLSDEVLSEPAPSSKKRKSVSNSKAKKATKSAEVTVTSVPLPEKFYEPPPSQKKQSPAPPSNNDEPCDVLDNILDKPAAHRYSTRAGNRHPAERLGLKKKFMADISAEAERKRREKAMEQEEKAAKKVTKQNREDQGVSKLVLLEAARALEDAKEDEYLHGGAARHYRAPVQTKAQDDEPVVEDVDYSDSESDYDGMAKGDHPSQGSDSSDIEFESSGEEGPVKKRKLTATEKKNIRKKELRASITADPPAAMLKSYHTTMHTVAAKPPKPKASRVGPSGAFDPACQPISDWKLDLLISPEAPKSNAVQRKPKPVSLKRSASYDSIEEIAGFKDEDVAIKRESVVKLERGHQAQIVSVIVDDEPKPKLPRKPKTPAKPTKTLAFSALPADVQPIYRTKLLTTLIEYYGGEKDPFDLDHGMDLFQTVTQHTVNKILPEKHIEIVKSGKPDNGRTYTIARQGHQGEDNRFSRTVAEIKKLVVEALEDDGEAYWGEWDRNDPDASRAWCSKYILKTLAYHIQATKGSILQKDSILPLGALALSIVAVQRAFLMYESGVFVPTDEFSDENVGDLTREYAAVNLQRLMDKPSRFRALVAKASAYTTDSSSQNRRKRKAGEGVKIRAVRIQDPSSPIPFDN
ncbi:hypothetical protein JAAARDRAFT_48473 [Jaapia argillacea MUCL 33604]|uniref:Uncharacterized protein n=1 Tax=Jaapia argillacea MUCL 33604 TaxID=933084 RepID=A0A067PXZ8_9AGAM|nr:hypothetical protein JAAARDRAFT_48473 [Jaapia argillacea MUCL 33604]